MAAAVAEAASPKQISAQELRDYLHLPAKDVAKELGVCLTSLKKICRQHGILRWPYRRLKMLDRKIQTLEHTMAEGVEDPEELRKQLEKLQNQRNSLPSNYGTCGLDEDDDSPSSPLSCASTAVPGADFPATRSPVDEGSEGDFDAISSTDTPTTPTTLAHPQAQEAEATGHAPMTAAAALISNISGAAAKRPASTQGTPILQKAPKSFRHHTPGSQTSSTKTNTTTSKAVSEEPGKVKTSTQGDGSMKVELCVPADIAGQVAQGAQLVVHQVNGKATLEIIPQSPSPTGGSNMVFELPQLPGSSAEAAQQIPDAIPVVAKKESPESKNTELSDEEMIAALIGASAEKNKADPPSAIGAAAPPTPKPLSDEELAAALAGCAGTEMDGQSPEVPPGEEDEDLAGVCDHDVQGWYDDGDDGDLGMNLFEGDI